MMRQIFCPLPHHSASYNTFIVIFPYHTASGYKSTFYFSKYLPSRLIHSPARCKWFKNMIMVFSGIIIHVQSFVVKEGKAGSSLYYEEKWKHIRKEMVLLTPYFSVHQSLLIIYRFLSMDVVLCLHQYLQLLQQSHKHWEETNSNVPKNDMPLIMINVHYKCIQELFQNLI